MPKKASFIIPTVLIKEAARGDYLRKALSSLVGKAQAGDQFAIKNLSLLTNGNLTHNADKANLGIKGLLQKAKGSKDSLAWENLNPMIFGRKINPNSRAKWQFNEDIDRLHGTMSPEVARTAAEAAKNIKIPEFTDI